MALSRSASLSSPIGCPFTRVGVYYDTSVVLTASHVGQALPVRTIYLLPMVWISRFVWFELPDSKVGMYLYVNYGILAYYSSSPTPTAPFELTNPVFR